MIGIDISPTACRVMAKRLRDVCGLPESEPLWKTVPKQHQTIEEIARCVFHNLRIEPSTKILSFKCDSWPGDLPGGAVD